MLCQVCLGAVAKGLVDDADDLEDEVKWLHHQPNEVSFEASVKSGCYVCNSLAPRIAAQPEEYPFWTISEFRDSKGKKLKNDRGFGGELEASEAILVAETVKTQDDSDEKIMPVCKEMSRTDSCMVLQLISNRRLKIGEFTFRRLTPM